ncbi:MAG: MFS transporter [Rhodospirillales bacterium]
MPRNETSRRRLTLASCCAAHSIQDGLTDVLYVLLPVLAQVFGLSYAQVGIIRAANRMAMTAFELPSGMLSERIGERLLIGFGLIAAGAGYLALAWADGFVAIVVVLLIAGIGGGFQHTLCSALVSRIFGNQGRRTALGTYNSFGDVGKLAFAGLFTLSIGAGIVWQDMVMVFGGLAILGGIVVIAALGRADAGTSPHAHQDSGAPSAPKGWGIKDKPAFGALCGIVLIDTVVQGGFLTFVAFLMIEKEVPTALSAFAVVLTLAGGAFGKFGCGYLAERLGVVRSLVLVEILTAVGIVAILLLPTLAAYFLLPILGMVLQGGSSITYGTVGDLIEPERQARGFAVIYSIATGAMIIGPMVFGLIGDTFGLIPAMLAMAVTILLALPLCLFMRRAIGDQYA